MSVSNNETFLNDLKNALLSKFDAEKVGKILEKHLSSLDSDYFVDYSLNEIVHDIEVMESLSEANPYAVCLRNVEVDGEKVSRVKLFKLKDKVSLSMALPIIENFGFQMIDEHPHKLQLNDGNKVYVCDFSVLANVIDAKDFNDDHEGNRLQKAIVGVFNGDLESDCLNRLVLSVGLTGRQIFLLRSLAYYLAQITLFSKQYLMDTLVSHPKVAESLFKLFATKFDVKAKQRDAYDQHKKIVYSYLDNVSSLDEDRILRCYMDVIEAMLRTNYYQLDLDQNPKSYVSFKVHSSQLSFLPKPYPMYEIFVYSERFEAIHLRAGKVARGGIRWSDRFEDYRTEVLGLMKAQVVKNAVIVPTGSKGGFVCKKLPAVTDRTAYMAEAVACYQMFISGLLDLTDNLNRGQTIAPRDVICYDDPDPYLVVAADKGTATFSDYANQVSLDYEFWLGDAFASGGSAGYDHKKIGITARGAWESAKRHFRHLGKNIQKEDFSVIGVGDMSGDVFGNGMLLSKHICLIAAFNHQHIFLDPNPSPSISFVERQRLFNLPQSTWDDYDRTKISEGGGIFSRSNKSIPLSGQVRKWLGINDVSIAPNELIQLILKAKADMFYNGGIGTYIKSSKEPNEAVHDKANDSIRVNGLDLQVKVVVEGGNLSVTQLGRVEFALNGGAIYTDALDNSAGVDCSDHEVNLKVLFAAVMQHTGMTIRERNKILETMTDEVAHKVLRDNYLQTEILRYAFVRAPELFQINMNFIEKLEKKGYLDRQVEFLPTAQEAEERQRSGKGLMLPELSVLLAYSKMILDKEILNSDLVNSNLFDGLLVNYFPKQVQEHYSSYIESHYLRKEIIATCLSNLVVNRMGITFVYRLEDELHVSGSDVIKVFWLVYQLVNAEALFDEIEALDNKVDATIQIEMLIRLKKSLERMTRWVFKNIKGDGLDIKQFLTTHVAEFKHLFDLLPELLKRSEYKTMASAEDHLLKHNVPDKLAAIVARSNYIPQMLEIVLITSETGHNLESIAHNYFYLGRMLRIDWLRRSLILLPENNKWQALARSALLTDGYKLYSILVHTAITHATGKDDMRFASHWISIQDDKVSQIKQLIDELQGYKILDLAMLSAAVREVANILQ